MPHPRSIARHALPSVVEGKLVPLALFLGFLRLAGPTAAVTMALVWSLSSIAWRSWTGRRVPGLVVLSTVGLTARTVVTLVTGDVLVYFLQPLLGTVLIGLAFLVSVVSGRPLAERLVHDVCPLDDETARHPHVRRFLTVLSVLWAITSLANASVTLWLLLTQPLATFVLVKAVLGPASGVLAIGGALVWLRATTRRHGLSLVMAQRRAPAGGAAPA